MVCHLGVIRVARCWKDIDGHWRFALWGASQRYYRGDFLPAREGLSCWYIHVALARGKEFGSAGQCGYHPGERLEMGVLVSPPRQHNKMRKEADRIWRVVAIVVGFNLGLLFFFVPETFWDRTPRPKKTPSFLRRASSSIFSHSGSSKKKTNSKSRRASVDATTAPLSDEICPVHGVNTRHNIMLEGENAQQPDIKHAHFVDPEKPIDPDDIKAHVPTTGEIYALTNEKTSRTSLDDYVRRAAVQAEPTVNPEPDHPAAPKTFVQSLRIYSGVLRHESWWKAAVRPVILFAYPAVLWSTVVYSLSVGWLIVLSETVAHIYQEQPYEFTRLQTGLVYLSPFIGGIIGTAVAGKASDIIVRAMCRRNGGVYEPEFRLVMGIPIAITTAIGLMGFGWSAQERDRWIIPTFFFGLISFGCSLGSTTAITFCVDSYRQYASEALVTLNFSKSKSPFCYLIPCLLTGYKKNRYLPRPRFLPLFQSLASGRRF